jgi:uncharacterized OB-fold protein
MSQSEDYLRDEYVTAFPETLDFWRNAALGIFVVPRCNTCSKVHWHPRAHCPFCHGLDLTWEKSSGKGHVYSFTVIRRKDAPYLLAYVKINEGPILMTNIVDCELSDVYIGMPVKVGFRSAEQGRQVPVFRPQSTS